MIKTRSSPIKIESGMVVRMLPIRTIGLTTLQKYKTWLLTSRTVRVERVYHAPRPEGGAYIIPKGFEFDGGSVPRWLLVLLLVIYIIFPIPGWLGAIMLTCIMIGLLIEKFGLMLTAFAVHDYAVRYGFVVTDEGNLEPIKTVSEANILMRRVNLATNDMVLLDLIAHAGVLIGARFAWRNYRNGKVAVRSWEAYDYGIHGMRGSPVYNSAYCG